MMTGLEKQLKEKNYFNLWDRLQLLIVLEKQRHHDTRKYYNRVGTLKSRQSGLVSQK